MVTHRSRRQLTQFRLMLRDMECDFGCSRSRLPPCRRRFAQAPTAAPGTEAACANSRTAAVPPLCSVLRYALLSLGRMLRREGQSVLTSCPIESAPPHTCRKRGYRFGNGRFAKTALTACCRCGATLESQPCRITLVCKDTPVGGPVGCRDEHLRILLERRFRCLSSPKQVRQVDGPR